MSSSATVWSRLVLQVNDAVSTAANVECGISYIDLWKAHGIGPAGKKIPLSKINIPANFQIARLSTGSACEEVCHQFSAVNSRTATTSIASQHAREDPQPTSLLPESSELYPRPGEGCTKSYCIRQLSEVFGIAALESETMHL